VKTRETQKKKETLFDKLNTRLNKKPKTEAHSLRGLSVTELEKELKTKKERVEQLEQSKKKYKVGLDRNQGRGDSTSLNIFSKKLDLVNQEVSVLTKEIRSISSLLDIKSDHKKTKEDDIF